MARKDDEWLVTHLITAEKIKKDDELGFGGGVAVAVVIFIILAIIGSFTH